MNRFVPDNEKYTRRGRREDEEREVCMNRFVPDNEKYTRREREEDEESMRKLGRNCERFFNKL